MKFLMFFFAVSFFYGCLLAQNRKTGSGHVTTENRAVSGFNNIDANGVFKVVLKQGTEESVIVETDDNLQELIQVRVENNTLQLGMKKNSSFGKATKMTVTVNFKSVNAIKNNLVGSLVSDGTIHAEKLKYSSAAVGKTELNLDVSDLDLSLEAVGSTVITGKATNCNFTNTAVGSFDGDDFKVENMKLKNNAVGSTAVNAKNLELDNNGVGKITNKNGK
jgi:hypothetical protein